MALRDKIVGFALKHLVEGPAQKQSLGELAAAMEKSAQTVEARLASKQDSERNRNVLRHIIGIERWGQKRLRVALGETLVIDEYDGYQPALGTPWATLRSEFQSTRQATLALIREMEQAGVQHSARVHHNDLGEVSPHGWLRYLDSHATRETMKMFR